MREHRPSESRRKRRRQLAHICIFTFYKTFYSTVLYYSSHYSKTFTRLSLFLSSSSLTSRSTSALLLFAFNSSSSSLFFDESIRLIARMVFASSSFDSFLKTSAFNRSCLASLSRRDVENTTAENPIKNVDASESFCQFAAFENLGLLIFLCGEASELEIRHFFYSLKSHSFFSCRGDSERESVKKSTARKESQTESTHRRCFFGRVHRGEREKEKSKGTLVGGENWSDRMFFHVRREKNVVLEPRHFGARMKDVIMEKIKLEVRLFIY